MTNTAVRIGVTGHQTLSPETRGFVAEAIRAELPTDLGLVGVTSLAAGADQLFARIVIERGGSLEVVVPAQEYESSFGTELQRDEFRALLSAAHSSVTLDFTEPSEEAYWAAGREVVERSDRMLAVWDGQPAGGLGGTADVVAYARSNGKPVAVIWPEGARRG